MNKLIWILLALACIIMLVQKINIDILRDDIATFLMPETPTSTPIIIGNKRIDQNERWEMLKDYLGVVEWEEDWACTPYCVKNDNHKKPECDGGCITKTILTDDENIKEWIELDCEYWLKNNGCTNHTSHYCDYKKYNKCKELNI